MIQNDLTDKNELLLVLMEECAEVQQEASKLMRFPTNSATELEKEIGRFVDHYNNRRVHESLDNLTPADVYNGRDRQIIAARNLVKKQTMRRRKSQNLGLIPLNEEIIKPDVYRECVH